MKYSRRQIISTSLLSVLASSMIKAEEERTTRYENIPAYFACNMESWWTNLTFMDRFRAAANAGFSAVEFWDYQDQKRDVNQIAKLCIDLNLSIIQFTAWQGPSLALTDNHKKFKEAIIRAVDTAITLGAPMFTVVGHQTTDKYSQKKSVKNYMDALASVRGILEESGKTMIIEPFNPVDHEGHFLNGSKDAVSICRTINSPNIKINWDLYHMQLTEGNLIDELKSGFDQVGYIQIADVPGRNQPGTGELNYNFIFKEIKKLKYDGPIGLECWPKGKDPEEAIRDLLASVDG